MSENTPFDIHRARELAQMFSVALRSYLTPRNLEIVNQRNDALPEGSPVCHSHDFCDANEAMIAAFRALFGRDSDPASYNDAWVVNEAWAIAKNDRFAVEDGFNPDSLCLRRVRWCFDDSLVRDGFTDDTRWNGWLNVYVTPEVHALVMDEFRQEIAEGREDPDILKEFEEMEPIAEGPRAGLYSYANGFTAREGE